MIRRTAYAFLYLEDELSPDLADLLRAKAPDPAARARVLALCLLTGERHALQREELDTLLAIPVSRWVAPGAHDPAVVERLCGRGLLLSDGSDGRAQALVERDAALSRNQWNLYAALYHYMTQWSGLDIREGEEDDAHLAQRTRAAARALAAAYGDPPPEFAPVPPGPVAALPGRRREEPLYRALTARRTSRTFDSASPMTLDQLDTVLMYVFGCHGQTRTAAEVTCIKRTSPSGGGLHPIEVYPVIAAVEGLAPGIYHYNVGEHSLSLIDALTREEAQQTVTSFTVGQSYFGAAHVSFVLAARFYRNHWKYRRHQKAYAGILMDAAHLSQTLYLVSADLGLGAYLTIAINARDVEARLGLDGISEGALAIAGCGPRGRHPSPLEPTFHPRSRAGPS